MQDSNNRPPVPDNTAGDAAATRQERGAENEEPQVCKNGPGQSEEAEAEGSVLVKLKQVVSKSLSHVPSLALDIPVTADGVLQRPYDSSSSSDAATVASSQDLLAAEQNDTDSLSAYEDASAETPEHERLYPGQSENLELPHDSVDDSQVGDGGTEQPKSPENCVVS